MDSLDLMLRSVSEGAVIVIDAMALVVICLGTVKAFVAAMGLAVRGGAGEPVLSAVWLSYTRWLVAGLTFQLAADIIESSVVPTWEGIGMLAAIAAIRTFLNYFLEKDIHELREIQREPGPSVPQP
jgi:uncharacterized membrane protein